MIVAFDTSTLLFLFVADALGPQVPGSAERLSSCQARITHLLSDLQKARARIIIPAPVLAEMLTSAGTAGPEWVRIITTSRHFRVAPFDVLAAVECAEMSRRRLGAGKITQAERRKAKFDEQIVAIAQVEGAAVIYSDDADIAKLVGEKMTVRGMADTDLPPQEAQGKLDFDPEANEPEQTRDD